MSDEVQPKKKSQSLTENLRKGAYMGPEDAAPPTSQQLPDLSTPQASGQGGGGAGTTGESGQGGEGSSGASGEGNVTSGE